MRMVELSVVATMDIRQPMKLAMELVAARRVVARVQMP